MGLNKQDWSQQNTLTLPTTHTNVNNILIKVHHVIVCYVKLCYIMLCYVKLCHAFLFHTLG
jgi:hypothetical protein